MSASRHDPELARAVGTVALSFSHVDALAFIVLRNFVSDLDHEVLRAVLRSDRASFIQEALRDLAKSDYLARLGDGLADELKDIASVYQHLAKRRNDVIHGLASDSEDGLHLLNLRNLERSVPTSVDTLLALAEELDAFEDRLSAFGASYIKRVYPEEHETHPGWVTVGRVGRGGSGTWRRYNGAQTLP